MFARPDSKVYERSRMLSLHEVNSQMIATEKVLTDSKLYSADVESIVWHRLCYAKITDKGKIQRLQKAQKASLCNMDIGREQASTKHVPLLGQNMYCEGLSRVLTGVSAKLLNSVKQSI